MKMKSSLEPIGIEIKDPKRFLLVALLVDRDDFLQDISDSRNLINIEKIPYELPEYPDEMEHVVKAYKNGNCTINDVRKIIEEICFDKSLPNIITYDKLLGSAVVMTEALLKKYSKGRSYFSVIFASMIANKVTDFDFPSTYMIEIDDTKDANYELGNYESKDGLVAIVVNRESTIKEVEKVYKHISKYRFRNGNDYGESWLREIYRDKIPTDKSIDTPSSTTDELEKIREWYWTNKIDGLGARKIWLNLNDKEKDYYTQDKIDQALTRYKKKLRIQQ
jgi:hypothetical protein